MPVHTSEEAYYHVPWCPRGYRKQTRLPCMTLKQKQNPLVRNTAKHTYSNAIQTISSILSPTLLHLHLDHDTRCVYSHLQATECTYHKPPLTIPQTSG
jgi:hypothetical protein